MVSIIGMVIIWIIALQLEQNYNHLSHSLLCTTMFSSGFALVSACVVKEIVRDKRVWSMLCSFSIKMDVD